MARKAFDRADEALVNQRLHDMKEDDLLQFLRETAHSLVAAVDRLEVLADERETDARKHSA